MPMKLYSMGSECFCVTYDPGSFLPTLSLYLKEPVVSSSFIRFRYDSNQKLMLKAAHFLSVLPSGISIDTDRKTLTITPSGLSVLNRIRQKVTVEDFRIYSDSLYLEFSLS